MKNLTAKQQEFLNRTAGRVGEKFDVATSTYSVRTNTFRPICYVNLQSLKGLAERGFVRIENIYWRGAEVVRL